MLIVSREWRVGGNVIVDVGVVATVAVAFLDQYLQVQQDVGVCLPQRNLDDREPLAKRNRLDFDGRRIPAAADADLIGRAVRHGDAMVGNAELPPAGPQ